MRGRPRAWPDSGLHSLLADARDPEMPGILNRIIKRRELFRPFGALITARALESYFSVNSGSPFMDLALPATGEFRHLYPAVVHVDNSVRIQCVSGLLKGSFVERLMEYLSSSRGIDVVINTSLNLAGEPIVCDASELCKFAAQADLVSPAAEVSSEAPLG